MLTIGISLLLVIFTISSFLILESNIEELKTATVLRNISLADGLLEDTDRFVNNRIVDFISLAQQKEILDALSVSNNEFKKLPDVEEFLEAKELELTKQTEKTDLFIPDIEKDQLSSHLREKISFYKSAYGYEVVKEIFVTNEYGANVALGSGFSDYRQDDEEWWQITKKDGLYVGTLEFNKNYDTYAIPFGIRIEDQQGNFLGVMRLLLSINDLLSDLTDDAEILAEENKHVVLLDRKGRIIYDGALQDVLMQRQVDYFNKITDSMGHFELDDNGIRKIVAYSSSAGFENFKGFGWTVLLIQDESSIVDEFVDVRNAVLFTFGVGLAAAIVIGLATSYSITNPLKRITIIAEKLSKGDFEIQSSNSRYKEIETILNAFNETTKSLKKLIETERELAATKAKIKTERLSAIGELAASMAHDLKNPLATIKTAIHLLKQNSDKLDVEIKNQAFPKMERAITRISHQLDDVLNYVRVTPLNQTDTSIKSLLQSAISSIEIPNNIKIQLPENDFILKCDTEKIEIVFINLLLNSIQAIDTSAGYIKIHMYEKNNELILEFEDSGKGISEDDKKKIFEPLYTTKQKGTGLGLAICKNIIEQHGWTLGVKTNPTVFFITIKKDSTNT